MATRDLTPLGVKRAVRRMAGGDYPDCPCGGTLTHAYNDDTTAVFGVFCPTCGCVSSADAELPVGVAFNASKRWRWTPPAAGGET